VVSHHVQEARLPVESILSGCGVVAEAVLILLLIRARSFRTLPAFFAYLCWCLVGDVTLLSLQSLPANTYFRVYEIQMVIDSAMIFTVLVELAWSVLRPLRSSLPRRSWLAIPFLIALAGLLIWPLAGLTLPGRMAPAGAVFFRLQQTFAILRVVIFFAMAGFSQLIGIGWRNRELQVATGLGFYSILSLAVTVMHSHQMIGQQYHWLDVTGSAGYLCAMTYWVYAFATKEAERQNFSPQMANFLLLIGGTAKASRVALADFPVTKARFKDH
jgi:hypothetical protein